MKPMFPGSDQPESISHPVSLEQRVAALEDQLRRWRRASALVMAGLAAALMAVGAMALRPPSAAADSVIEAQQLVLRDGEGRKRAELALEANGSPSLGLYDAEGQRRVRLALDVDGWPRLSLGDAKKVRLWAGLDSEGTPQLLLHDQQGARRVELTLCPKGSPRLFLLDPTQTPRAALGVDEYNSPGVFLRGPDGVSRAGMSVLPEGNPMLGLGDKGGNVVFRAP